MAVKPPSRVIVDEFSAAKELLFHDELKLCTGIEIVQKFTGLMDGLICSLFAEGGFDRENGDGNTKDLAVVALGSYGRGELCCHSDVDFMIIHQGPLSARMREMIPLVLYPLWDAGLEVGHSILTFRECLHLSLDDFRVFTSLLDARFVLGSRSFFRLFQDALWARIDREKEKLLGKFLLSRKKRVEKYDSENFFVEPELKEGPGGLRDLHLMSWMARVYFSSRQLRDMRRFSEFSYFEFDDLEESRGFLLKIRNHLHFLTGRKEDRFLLSHQKALSQILDYQEKPEASGPENLMKDLYLHLNRVRYGYEEFHAKALDMIDPQPVETDPDKVSSEFRIMKGNIVLKDGFLSEKDPMVILRGLYEAGQRGLFIGSGFIWEAKKILSREGRSLTELPEAKELFLKIILKTENARVIRLLLELGLITLFIPEFKKLRNLAQFGFYHVMTVDLHSLRTLEILGEMGRGVYDERWGLFREVFECVTQPDWLLLAGLLHDIGKGRGGNHSEKGSMLAPGIIQRLGLNDRAGKTISILVLHHLLLSNISQRRDLNEEKTVVQVAQIVQDVDILHMIFLLNVADSFATGPMARSDWKIFLLIELYLKVKRILESGILATPDATREVSLKKEAVRNELKEFFREEDVLRLIEQTSSRYFLSMSQEEMFSHFRMALTLGENAYLWELKKIRDASVTRVILCTRDKPGLFSRMVGVFTLNNMEVLSARIFTLKNGLAFDVFEVTNPPDRFRQEEQWLRTGEDLGAALGNDLPLDSLILAKVQAVMVPAGFGGSIKKKVKVDNDTSDFFTLIEVDSGSRMGLLYDLAKEISASGLDIRSAKVSSDRERMTGVFYVRDSDGQKIYDEEQIAVLREKLTKVQGWKP